MKWAEQQLEKQRQLLIFARARMHHARYIIRQNDDWVVEVSQMKNIADENTSSFSDAIWTNSSQGADSI